jgi:phage-related protein
VSFLSGIWSSIVSTAEGAWNGFVSWLESIPSQIINAFSQLPTQMENLGIGIINGLISGIQSAAQTVISYVQSLASWISSTIASALKIASPSMVFYEHGRNIILGLCEGMRDHEDEAYRFMDDFGRRIGDRWRHGGSGGQWQPPGLVNRFTTPVGATTATAGAGAAASYAAQGGITAGSGIIQNFYIGGSVVAETTLRQVAQQGVLRYTRRNPGNGWFLPGRQS